MPAATLNLNWAKDMKLKEFFRYLSGKILMWSVSVYRLSCYNKQLYYMPLHSCGQFAERNF